MKIIKDKKAGEKYLTPWLFLIWALIFVAITGSVIYFYSKAVDVRIDEANILAMRIEDCIVDNGYLKEPLLNKDSNFDILKECSLDKSIIDNNEGLFYLNVSVYDESEKLLKETTKGNKNFQMQCGIKNEEKFFADCTEKKVYALDEENQKLKIVIFTGSNQLGAKL